MRYLPLLFAVPLLFLVNGCSCSSQIEREEFTSRDSREVYVEGHPGSVYQENILNGEIVRGMSVNEVVASWGMPNVYLASRDGGEERLVYYVQQKGMNSVLVYMLDFDENDILKNWDIDQKRLSSYSLVDYEATPERNGNITRSTKNK